MKKVFIDGSAGTTGLRIKDRLSGRRDIELIKLSEEDRKDVFSRKAAINESDITFLCLPDSAAIEAVSLAENENTVIIDTSTAHRTSEGWAYGFPELSDDFKNAVLNSRRIAVPGCHASGFIALTRPLVESGAISPSARLFCHSVTGYSGGGKKMIAEYESAGRNGLLDAPRQYGITQNHKHLKEMVKITGLNTPPVFCPVVSDFYSGMTVTVPLFKEDLNEGFKVSDIKRIYSEKYRGPVVSFSDYIDEGGFISGGSLSGLDSMKITIAGNEDRILLIAAYDNLGKGASGAAVQCLNMVMGADITTGLNL